MPRCSPLLAQAPLEAKAMRRWWRSSQPPGIEDEGHGVSVSQPQNGEEGEKMNPGKKKMSTKLPLTYDPDEDLSMPGRQHPQATTFGALALCPRAEI